MTTETACLAALKSTLQLVARLQDKVFEIETEDQLVYYSNLVELPAAGIIYEGLRSNGDVGKGTHKTGINGEIGVAVVVYYRASGQGGQETALAQKEDAITLLKSIRDQVIDTQAPNMKWWRFVSEMRATETKGLVVWVQRWSLPVLLNVTP